MMYGVIQKCERDIGAAEIGALRDEHSASHHDSRGVCHGMRGGASCAVIAQWRHFAIRGALVFLCQRFLDGIQVLGMRWEYCRRLETGVCTKGADVDRSVFSLESHLVSDPFCRQLAWMEILRSRETC